MKTKYDFQYMIGKEFDKIKLELEKPYYLFIGENNGRTIYRTMEYEPYRIIVSVSDGIIFRVDDVC